MRKITFYLSDEVEKKVRNLTYERFGRKKGALSILTEQIFREYFRKLWRVAPILASNAGFL